MSMNEQAARVADEMEAHAEAWGVRVTRAERLRLIDCITGGLNAGVALARAALADRAEVRINPARLHGVPAPSIAVHSDEPVTACLACQYAGWQIQSGNYFAMGSGPMRAAAAREPIFKEGILPTERPPVAVGTLETKKAPPEDVITQIRERLPETVEELTLMFAPCASLAGTVQVVARALETALHKLHELKFDPRQVRAGYGEAPLPPIAPDELKAIGWANDAILYAGRVTLWVDAEDDLLAEIGPQVPSRASADHGAPFAELFARYGDFYKIDPLLFSPAEVVFQNLRTGRCHIFGGVEPEIFRSSIGL